MDNSVLYDAIRRRRSKRYEQADQDEGHEAMSDKGPDTEDGLAPRLKGPPDQMSTNTTPVGSAAGMNHEGATGEATQPMQDIDNPELADEVAGLFKRKSKMLNKDNPQAQDEEEEQTRFDNMKSLPDEQLDELVPDEDIEELERFGRKPRGLWERVQANVAKVKKQKKGEVKR